MPYKINLIWDCLLVMRFSLPLPKQNKTLSFFFSVSPSMVNQQKAQKQRGKSTSKTKNRQPIQYVYRQDDFDPDLCMIICQ
jgi:hypothetical protein